MRRTADLIHEGNQTGQYGIKHTLTVFGIACPENTVGNGGSCAVIYSIKIS